MTEPVFGRLVAAMVTPFDADLNVDFARAQALAKRLVDGGCDALAVCATTGESPTITHEDKLRLFKEVAEAVAGRAKVIAYCGGNNTAASVADAKEYAALGCIDGFLTVVPYYNKPPQAGLYEHYRAIAQAVPSMPILMYNIPGRSGINMTAETTLALARDFDNIVGIKEASSKQDQIATIAKEAPEGFCVYSGNDDEVLQIMGYGGVGVVSTIANVAPARYREVIDLYVNGQKEAAQEALDALRPLMKELFVTANPIMAKEALDILGFPVGGLRLPLVKATAEQRAEMEDVLRLVGDIR